ncbi:probable cytochrome P450 4aa1 isoform X2 [Aethina tumida]|uniref:probable cytochrome P450 4aa1 isoform X2 n=1 Tax=Aethina tumida TaxID=116153 RepID=UPI0021498536|nr:probable cytochrome P450 4aa1 isoform X2 [Aethina tumida]
MDVFKSEMDGIQILWLIFVVALLVYKYFKNYIRSVLLALSLPGPKPIPLLGNVLLVAKSSALVNLGLTVFASYGRIFRVWVSCLPFFCIYEPEHLQHVLSCSKKTEKNILYKLMHNFLGEGLITNNGDKWRLHRKLIQPFFHLNILEMNLPYFIQGAQELVDRLKNKSDVNITTYVNETVLNILNKSVLGINPAEDSPYRKGQITILYRTTRPWLMLESLFKFTSASNMEDQQKSSLHAYTRKILEERKQSANLDKNNVCLLNMMLTESGKDDSSFTEDDIINELCTFMLAGQDSTGTALACALRTIAQHQDVQEKIMQEQNSIFTTKNEQITLDHLNSMKYLEQCIKESLRLYPPVPMISRILTQDVKIDKDNCLPVGSNVFICPFVTHRLPHVFKDPHVFNPDRFSSEGTAKMHPYAFLPFGLGQRQCIGYKYAYLELKTILSIFLRSYHVSLAEDSEVSLKYRVTLRIKGGVKLHIEPRQNSLDNRCL